MRLRPSSLLFTALALAAAGCGKGDTKPSVDLTFYLSPTLSPTAPTDKQDFVISWTLFNADQLSGHADNVAWTVSRDGVPNAFTGTVASIASRAQVPLSITDIQPIGIHTYVITIDPANAIHEVSEDNNTRTVAVTVQGLVIQ